MHLRRYLSVRRADRALRLLGTWWRMPHRIEAHSISELLPTLDPKRTPQTPDPRAVEDLADAVILFVDRWQLPLDNRCLPRTLSLYQCLRREGLELEVVFGVRPGPRIEEGHAWLEMDGHPLLEPARRMQGFVPIFRHPPRSVEA